MWQFCFKRSTKYPNDKIVSKLFAYPIWLYYIKFSNFIHQKTFYYRPTIKPQISMEVHHHPHVEKKGFKEYFLEGLMIFLAVSMGFIAENIREKFIENERAHELAESLYQEVYNDSVSLQKVFEARIEKEHQLNYYINFIKDSSITNINQRFYRSFTWSFLITSPILFEPSEGMISQLRNSGSLRYFKNNELQKEVSTLSVLISKVKNRIEVENSFSHNYVRSFILKHYNFRWSDEISKQGSTSLPEAIKNAPDPHEPSIMRNSAIFNKTEAENLASYYLLILKNTRLVQLKNYMDASHTLLETLRKEYSFKKE